MTTMTMWLPSRPGDIVVYLCDKDLKPVTDPIAWTNVDATMRHLEPGSGAVTCAATPQVTAELAAADTEGRIGVIVHREQVFMAGEVEVPHGDYLWSAGGGENAEPGQATFHLTDYLGLVAARRTYPNPGSPWATQTVNEHYTATGVASTVLRAFINVQAGPGAHTTPDRRVPHLVMGSDPLAGGTISISERFDWVLEVARRIVTLAGGAIGYRCVLDQAARTVTFEVYETPDLSGSVRFSRGLGNLRSVQFNTEMHRVSTALVAGQGEGTARTTLERTNAAAEAIWRKEDLVDARSDATTPLLEQAGDERLAENAAKARLGTVLVDTPDQPITVDLLGALVTVEPTPGLLLADTVRAVHLSATPRKGSVVTATVGVQSQRSEPEWLRLTRELARRLSRLEAI